MSKAAAYKKRITEPHIRMAGLCRSRGEGETVQTDQAMVYFYSSEGVGIDENETIMGTINCPEQFVSI